MKGDLAKSERLEIAILKEKGQRALHWVEIGDGYLNFAESARRVWRNHLLP